MMPHRFVHLEFVLDTNRINARARLESMNRLEKWRRDGVILLIMTDVSQSEAMAGSSPGRSRKAASYIYSITPTSDNEFRELERQIETILFPNGVRNQNEKNDVSIACNALVHHHHSPLGALVTADGIILRNRSSLAQLGLKVMTDAEAVSLVECRIKERDEEARETTAEIGQPLPNWVGQD